MTSARRCASAPSGACRSSPRGGGTSLAGPDRRRARPRPGLLAPHERDRRRSRSRRVRVEPGVVQEDLNRAAKRFGLGLRAGHVDVEPGDARRHDRQQLERVGVDRATARRSITCSSSRSCWPTGRRRRSRASRAHRVRRAGAGGAARARAGDRRGLPEALAPVRRLPARPHRPVRPVQARRRLARARSRSSRPRPSGWSSCRRSKMFSVGHFESVAHAIAATQDALDARAVRRSR